MLLEPASLIAIGPVARSYCDGKTDSSLSHYHRLQYPLPARFVAHRPQAA